MYLHNILTNSVSRKCIVILFVILPICTGFGYSKRDQHEWSKEYKTCAGKRQSPIAISSSRSVACSLPALEMIGYHDLLPRPLSLKNDGHSVELHVTNNLTNERLPYISGAVFESGQEYEMEGLHFHWGSKNDRGSEHVLHGVRYPMEMHIIHRNMKYDNLSTALEHSDGLCVLAIFFQLQEEDNKQLSVLLDNFRDIKWKNTEIETNMSITLDSLMPENTDIYYTYKGSLTTPPCNEVVTWIIFSTPVPMSFRQIGLFRNISDGERPLADNYRYLQDINRRKIYVRKLSPSVTTKCYVTTSNVTNLKWCWS